ncbi:hypothetical protein BDW22DRAFT_1216803 [Trametopsis cervina]|nr:hypothetical protein BDW22DRAFT_1216803 [Trametopsis cervina]
MCTDSEALSRFCRCALKAECRWIRKCQQLITMATISSLTRWSSCLGCSPVFSCTPASLNAYAEPHNVRVLRCATLFSGRYPVIQSVALPHIGDTITTDHFFRCDNPHPQHEPPLVKLQKISQLVVPRSSHPSDGPMSRCARVITSVMEIMFKVYVQVPEDAHPSR